MASDQNEAADATVQDADKRPEAKARREIAEVRTRMKLAGEAMKAALAERKALKLRQVALAGDNPRPRKKTPGTKQGVAQGDVS